MTTGVGLLLLLSGSTAQAGWLFVLSAGVLGLAGGSLAVRHRLKSAEVIRSVPSRLRVGDTTRVGLTLINNGRKPLPMLKLADAYPAFEPIGLATDRVPAQGRVEIELTRTAARRGVFDGADVELTSGAPFGMARSRRRIAVATRTVVVPHWVELRSFPILEPSSLPSDQLHERARTGAGEEFLGVRDYRPGDPPRSVHWRSTARAQRLVVREFEEMTYSRVAVVVGGPDAGLPPDSAFEAVVSAAASVALYALTTGHPVDLVRSGRPGMIDRLGGAGRVGILEWLASAHPSEDGLEPLAAAAAKAASRHGTVILCATEGSGSAGGLRASARIVQGMGARAIVVAADGDSWVHPEGRLDDLRRGLTATRTTLRILTKGKDLATCLGA
ncbi:MAG TPA: DUF58 domain-containing protein [Actinomycetota bacterium]|nr:DUF58 domain-containing protein [Actinomycetota bacterium]